jgi:DNA polymerase-3 subunit delta
MAKQLAHYEFLRDFAKQKPAPVYLIHGTETYLIDRILAAITKRFVTPGSEDFDYSLFYGDTAKGSDILEQLEMMPFLAHRRVVLARRIDELNVTERDTLAEYAKNPMESSILVLTATKTDGRQSAWKIIMKHAVVVQCKQPYGASDIQRWLNSEVRTRRLQMDHGAMALFANSIEPNYQLAANELEKLIIYAKGGPVISLAAVQACVGKSRTNNIFELQNAVGARNNKQALTILENMIEGDESPILVVTMLTRFFTLIWRVAALMHRGVSSSDITAKHLPEVYHTFRNDYLGFARHYSRTSLAAIFSLLLQADVDLKSQETYLQRIILERLIMAICKTK